MKLISVDEFRQKYFSEASRPARNTVRAWVQRRRIPGQVIERSVYVDEAAWLEAQKPAAPEKASHRPTGNPLVDRVLQS